MRMTNILTFLFLISFFVSCSVKHTNDSRGETLNVDLNAQHSIKFDDLFSKVEIIPLETHDSCLIINIGKVFLCNRQLYVFDQIRPSLYVFDENGRFVKQISRMGNGPGEYQAISDVAIEENGIALVSPFGSVLFYNIDGEFIEQKVLPIKPNYYALSHMKNGNWAFWSCVEKEEAGISVVEGDSMKLLYGAWYNDRMLDMGLMKPFYQYNKTSYFGSAYQNIVYKVGTDSLEIAYQWNFGNENIDEKKLLAYSKIENGNERNNRILNDLENGILTFSMENHNQNKQYYYVALRKGVGAFRPWMNVFYRKTDGKTFVFEKIEEGIKVCPISFTNEYLISVLSFDDIKMYENVLSHEEFSKLSLKKEDENPCLVKLYFK